MITAKEHRASLEEAGITGPALDAAVKAAAPGRHQARVRATLEAALSAVLPERPEFASDLTDWIMGGRTLAVVLVHSNHLLRAWALLSLDLGGAAGEGGTGKNGVSARLPPFAGLGSGRWKAKDGKPYRGAGEEACRLLAAKLPGAPAFVVIEGAIHAASVGASGVHAISVSLPPVPAGHLRALCLRQIAALSPDRLPLDGPAWANVYNALQEGSP
jgi:hypothetical protein